MATIVYLDAEDEITSAATRIRRTEGSRVAIVVPFGSRVATSRINFKLLAREAMVNGKRLDIIAPDASARALAASAGIPVFGSVGEYEEALDRPDEPATAQATAATAQATAAAPAGAIGAGGVDHPDGAKRRGAATGAPAAPTTALAGAAASRRHDPDPQDLGTRDADPRERATREAELDQIVRRGREVPVAKPQRRGPRKGLIMGVLLLVVALAVAGGAGWLLLPSATITVTPQVEPVGPIELVVRADPGATAVDVATGVIPAQTVALAIDVSGDFPATGKRVAKTAAQGGVRWRNCDPSSSYTIPKATIVRTQNGTQFAMDESLFLPVAVISGGGTNVNLKCQTSEVSVTALEAGPSGNVAKGTIRIIPGRYNRTLISVTNPAATSGGKREEFTRVSQKDVDAALASLSGQLATEFQARLESPEGVPAGATVFPETAVMGQGTPTVDPLTLLNQEVPSFTLGLTTTGSVLAVDASPVEAIAATTLKGAIKPGYGLVDGSTRVVVGEGTVRDGIVTFPVAGTAKQLRPVDGEALRARVLGLPDADARALLAPYGKVDIVLWPGFVVAVPTLEGRVTLTVAPPADTAPNLDPVPPTPEPAAQTDAPAGSSDGGDPSQPLPSG